MQLSNFELREVSRYIVALKASRTARGVPLFEDIPIAGALFRPAPSDESSLQQNVVLAQATIFPTLFDLMGLRWAPVLATLGPQQVRKDQSQIRERYHELRTAVMHIGAEKVDEVLRLDELRSQGQLGRPKPETIPPGYPSPDTGYPQGPEIENPLNHRSGGPRAADSLPAPSPQSNRQPGPRLAPGAAPPAIPDANAYLAPVVTSPQDATPPMNAPEPIPGGASLRRVQRGEEPQYDRTQYESPQYERTQYERTQYEEADLRNAQPQTGPYQGSQYRGPQPQSGYGFQSAERTAAPPALYQAAPPAAQSAAPPVAGRSVPGYPAVRLQGAPTVPVGLPRPVAR